VQDANLKETTGKQALPVARSPVLKPQDYRAPLPQCEAVEWPVANGRNKDRTRTGPALTRTRRHRSPGYTG